MDAKSRSFTTLLFVLRQVQFKVLQFEWKQKQEWICCIICIICSATRSRTVVNVTDADLLSLDKHHHQAFHHCPVTSFLSAKWWWPASWFPESIYFQPWIIPNVKVTVLLWPDEVTKSLTSLIIVNKLSIIVAIWRNKVFKYWRPPLCIFSLY